MAKLGVLVVKLVGRILPVYFDVASRIEKVRGGLKSRVCHAFRFVLGIQFRHVFLKVSQC